jgi:hypothetical protein
MFELSDINHMINEIETIVETKVQHIENKHIRNNERYDFFGTYSTIMINRARFINAIITFYYITGANS